MTKTKPEAKLPPSRVGKVRVGFYASPGVRRGINMVTSFDDISLEEFIKPRIREALIERGLPVPAELEPEPAAAN